MLHLNYYKKIYSHLELGCWPGSLLVYMVYFSFVIALHCLVKEIQAHGVTCHLFHTFTIVCKLNHYVAFRVKSEIYQMTSVFPTSSCIVPFCAQLYNNGDTHYVPQKRK
jgi:hypothetical protein